MKKALLYLDEDLASSMAFRFAAAQGQELDMALQPFHVVEPEGKAPEDLGWVSRSWERAQVAGGLDKVNRLVRTENIAWHQADEPKIALGDKDQETLRELAGGGYSLFVEGYLDKSDPSDFLCFLNAARFRKNPCPLLLVKNLVDPEQLLLLLDREMDAGLAVSHLTDLYGDAARDLDLTVLYYKSAEGGELVFQQRKKGSSLDRIEALLAQAGWNDPEWMVVQGPPEKAAGYMQGHGLVVTLFPGLAGARAELLAHLANPVLLFQGMR
ncbi:MAG: hypothetical protein ACYC9M_09075 [Desulfobulbaceae bacterium]